MMKRAYNFGAGPAGLPDEVMLEVQQELMNWQEHGMSVMEMGHRTQPIMDMIQETEQLFRTLLAIPSNYHVLFFHGPGRLQFSMIPMNLLDNDKRGGYLVTGIWSEMALQEAKIIKNAYCVASSHETDYTTVPHESAYHFEDNTAYFYFTPNETIHGLRTALPTQLGGLPVIADMTSCLLSEPIDVSKYGLIFAGAQKNIANSGLAVVIVRDDLIHKKQALPSMLNYRFQADTQSIYATPPTFNCYIAHKVLQWVKKQGGVETMHQLALQRANALYQAIDNSDYYECKVAKENRSIMNVRFNIRNAKLEEQFLIEAEQEGLLALKGHQSLGGLRASIYNAMPLAGVNKLVAFMSDFSSRNPL